MSAVALLTAPYNLRTSPSNGQATKVPLRWFITTSLPLRGSVRRIELARQNEVLIKNLMYFLSNGAKIKEICFCTMRLLD